MTIALKLIIHSQKDAHESSYSWDAGTGVNEYLSCAQFFSELEANLGSSKTRSSRSQIERYRVQVKLSSSEKGSVVIIKDRPIDLTMTNSIYLFFPLFLFAGFCTKVQQIYQLFSIRKLDTAPR